MASITEIKKGKFKLTVEFGYDEEGKRLKKCKTVLCKNKTEAKKELAKLDRKSVV